MRDLDRITVPAEVAIHARRLENARISVVDVTNDCLQLTLDDGRTVRIEAFIERDTAVIDVEVSP